VTRDLPLVQSDLLRLIHDEFRVAGNSIGQWAVTSGQDAKLPVSWLDVEALRQCGLVTVFVSRVPAVWYDRQVELTAAGLSHLHARGVMVCKPPAPFRGYEMPAFDVDARRRQVLEMHDAGARQKDIAAALGVSQSRAGQLVHAAVKDREERRRQVARQLAMAKAAAMAVRERPADLLRDAERRACAALAEVSIRRALAIWSRLGQEVA